MRAIEIYEGSDGQATTRYYMELAEAGAIGTVAVNIFRAQKNSARAKSYRGGIRGKGSFKSMAYDRKNWSLQNLSRALVEFGTGLGMRFGWKRDPNTPGYEWVLYVDLPQGQVSFHSAARYDGPDYAGDWDGQHLSRDRILAFCDAVYAKRPAQPSQLNFMQEQMNGN